jgi:hypothetical protein
LLNPEHPAFADKLLRDEWFQEKAYEGEEWFRHCDQNPATLLEDLKTRENQTMLLGRYFEALLSFWIREYLKPEIFYGGIPVFEHQPKHGHGRNTVGEFDFLLKLADPLHLQPYHWEASVKFYLCAGQTADQSLQMNHYFGTFLRDRLDIKVAKIFDHQLKLSERLDGEATLAYLGLPHPLAKAWVKGMLFYPAESDWKNHLYPAEVSPLHQRGWWTEVGQLDIPVENPDDRWVILPKYRWLSPAMVPSRTQSNSESEQTLFTLDEMKAHCQKHFSEHLSPLMWAEISWDELTKAWHEVNRGLVVYLRWGAAARASLERAGELAGERAGGPAGFSF